MADAGYSAILGLISQTLGDKFLITETSLTLNPKAVVSDEDMRLLIATLSRHTDNSERLNGSFLWYLGDTCNILQEYSPDPDSIIAEAVAATHRKYHTVKRAIKLSKFFPPEKRIPEWTATHHAEIMNYAGNFAGKMEVLEAVVSRARAMGKMVVVSPTGEEMVTYDPISSKELREMLREAAGKSQEDQPDRPRFLYFNLNEMSVHYTKTFVSYSEDTMRVIDLKQLGFVDAQGRMTEVIKPLK